MGERRQNNPFIKNVYYPGKLLHASDFECEQNYASRKLEFINRKFYGCGIIEGLGVQLGQKGAVGLESGSAIDPQGRILIVPSDTILHTSDIEGLANFEEKEFILGINYIEKTIETERYLLEENETYHAARKQESYFLKAYRLGEWQEQKQRLFQIDSLVQRRVMYEDETVRLVMEVPRLVPSDSIFRVRIIQQAVSGKQVTIGWHGMARLQGGRFLATDHSHLEMHAREMILEGNAQQEWEIYTEEDRQLPVVFELERFEIFRGSTKQGRADNIGFSIETTKDYRRSIQRLFQERQNASQSQDWIPLAHFEISRLQDKGISLKLIQDSSVCIFAVNPLEEAFVKELEKQHGIVEIPWRSLLQSRQSFPVRPKYSEVPASGNSNPPAVMPLIKPSHPSPDGGDPSTATGFGPSDTLHSWEKRKEWFIKLLAEERNGRCKRGVTVIPIPKHYKRGQVLFSDEISHGYPGEEVFLWCGRVWEEHNYAYWDREKTKYVITHGSEVLFSDIGGNGWMIENQSLRQNVDAGTFQIALTLAKGRRGKRYMEREVAVSWIAVRTM